MKKVCFSLIILSYFLIGFILIYFNKINPDHEGNLGLTLSIVVIAIWLISLILLTPNKNKRIVNTKDKTEEWLRVIALAPIMTIVLTPAILFGIVVEIVGAIRNTMKNKCKILLKKNFVLTKEKHNKKIVYLLTKENFVIRICEFDSYEISLDYGATHTKITNSPFISYDDRIEIENIINKYSSCDYRDRDIYEPTSKIIEILVKYFD